MGREEVGYLYIMNEDELIWNEDTFKLWVFWEVLSCLPIFGKPNFENVHKYIPRYLVVLLINATFTWVTYKKLQQFHVEFSKRNLFFKKFICDMECGRKNVFFQNKKVSAVQCWTLYKNRNSTLLIMFQFQQQHCLLGVLKLA